MYKINKEESEIIKKQFFEDILKLRRVKGKKLNALYNQVLEEIVQLGITGYGIDGQFSDYIEAPVNGSFVSEENKIYYRRNDFLLSENPSLTEIANKVGAFFEVMEHENLHARQFEWYVGQKERSFEENRLIDISASTGSLILENIAGLSEELKEVCDLYPRRAYYTSSDEMEAYLHSTIKVTMFFKDLQAYIEKKEKNNVFKNKFVVRFFSKASDEINEKDFVDLCIKKASQREKSIKRIIKREFDSLETLVPEMKKACRLAVGEIKKDAKNAQVLQRELMPLMLREELHDKRIIEELICYNQSKAINSLNEECVKMYKFNEKMWKHIEKLYKAKQKDPAFKFSDIRVDYKNAKKNVAEKSF